MLWSHVVSSDEVSMDSRGESVAANLIRGKNRWNLYSIVDGDAETNSDHCMGKSVQFPFDHDAINHNKKHKFHRFTSPIEHIPLRMKIKLC